MLQIQLK